MDVYIQNSRLKKTVDCCLFTDVFYYICNLNIYTDEDMCFLRKQHG